jgi:hypothetical protein
VIAIGSILIKLIKGILMKSAQASLKAAQATAQKNGRAFDRSHPAVQKFKRLQHLLKIATWLGIIIDFGGVLLVGFGIVLMLAVFSSNDTTCEDTSPDINLPDSNDKGKYDLEDVSLFAKEGLTSNWGISNTDAELLFLKTNKSVASSYGLTAQNIKNVSQGVSAQGVSPVFFWLYAINEGGGAGGFINHYSSGSGNATADAERDAQYLVKTAAQEGKPATGGGEPEDMPTAEAATLLKASPKGSIGKVYIQATSATTAEIESLAGKTGGWTDLFGRPLSDMMKNIKSLNGNWANGDDPKTDDSSTGGTSNDASEDDDPCSTDGNDDEMGTIKAGGMKLKEAQQWMTYNYLNATLPSDYYGEAPGEPDVHDNCTVFSGFFVANYTDFNWLHGNGGEIVDNLIASNKGLKKLSQPEPYAIFSVASNSTPTGSWSTGKEGHTGVVLGIDGKNAIIGEAAYGLPYTDINSEGSGVNVIAVPLSYLTPKNGWSFVSTDGHLKNFGQ